MTKFRGVKSSLLTSVVSLFICVAMLVGTTFAWFTDSVTSAGNVIQSGTLDVEMYWAEGTEDPATVAWEDASSTAIFNYDNWEPGYVDVKHVKIANLGSLALKYIVNIKANGEVSNLIDVIDVYFVDPAVQVTDRAALLDEYKIGTLADVLGGNGAPIGGKLLAEESVSVTIALKMQEDAGNEYQDLSIGSDFSVQVLATQLAAENDSFGPDYDSAATYLNKNADGAWEIADLGQLVYFAKTVSEGNSYAGETVVLVDDIDLDGFNWEPIGNWENAFEGTFDGQGHVISNMTINSPAGEGVGFFGVVANATIKNLTINNADISAYSMAAGIVGAAYPATIENCHITGDVAIVADWAYVGGIAGYCYYGTQVDGCSVIAEDGSKLESVTRNAVGGITAWLLEGDHKVTNCSVENLDLIAWTNVGGITGFVHYNNTIENCSVKDVNLIKTRVDGNPGIGAIAGGYSYSAANAITLSNNSVENVTMSGNHIAYASYNELYGSEYGGSTSANFVLNNNTVSGITKNLVEVKAVKTAAELKAALATGGEIVLSADITVGKNDTITIANGVSAVINMNGKTISGTADKSGNQELFLVKGNLTVENGSINYVAENNQGWGAMITIFDVTAGGALSLENVDASVSGSDMSFIAHLNNWGAASIDVDNCDFYAPYVAVRAFNSGYDMNNVTIKNTDVTGGGRLFWVHNYTNEGAGDATLNLDIYGNNNTCENASPVRFGFSGSVCFDLDGNQI